MSDALFLLLAIALGLALRCFVLCITFVRGRSMQPTLQNGDVLLVLRLPALLGRIRRGDVVICRYPGQYWRGIRCFPRSFVKRVAALPGDTLEMQQGALYVGGQTVDEPWLDPALCRFSRSIAPRTLGAEEYFVLGDHRDCSRDSRSVGPIRRRAITGRVCFILWPPRRSGPLR